MKKNILLLLCLLFITGCSCKYDLKIENNKFQEIVTISSNDASEVSNFNQQWEVPIDKEEYNIGLDTGSKYSSSKVYNYKLSGNSLRFNYDFTAYNYSKSSAVSNCYEQFTVLKQGNTTIISTSSKTICFDKYPTLTNVTVNITTDMEAKDHNADSVNGSTYTWTINRENAKSKQINMVLVSKDTSSATPSSSPASSTETTTKAKSDYSYYIFAGILLVVALVIIGICKFITKKEDRID